MEHYFLPNNKEMLEKHVKHSKIWSGPKKTYLDYEMQLKKDVPNHFYEIS